VGRRAAAAQARRDADVRPVVSKAGGGRFPFPYKPPALLREAV